MAFVLGGWMSSWAEARALSGYCRYGDYAGAVSETIVLRVASRSLCVCEYAVSNGEVVDGRGRSLTVMALGGNRVTCLSGPRLHALNRSRHLNTF